jgi:hypothetical protein
MPTPQGLFFLRNIPSRVLVPVGQRCLNQRFVEPMDIDAAVVQPATDPSLLALGLVPTAGQVGQPTGKVDLTALNQGGYHPQTGS